MTTAIPRPDYVLAVLSTAAGAPWTPVQVQKIFFLLDRKIPGQIGGPRWNFTAYDYGPFDSDVYREIEALEPSGLAYVEKPAAGGMRTFRLTANGQAHGQNTLTQFPEAARAYVTKLASWLRSLSFQQLVSAVYVEAPEMRANSIFRE